MSATAERLAALLLPIALALSAGGFAQEAPPKPPAPPESRPEADREPRPVAPSAEYMGRRIAAPMSYEAGPWLVRQTREKEESCAELLRSLGLKTGDAVADVGCGNGFYTFRLAEMVGAKGKVYAVDIQPEMLALLAREAEKRRADAGGAADAADKGRPIENIVPILGTEKDPKLPEGAIDLAFLVDVYHEFAYPAEMLAALKKSLKPGGRVVLVEFRLEDPEVPIKLEHKMTKAQINKELGANGFELAEEYDRLPWQHVMFFRAIKAPKAGEPGPNREPPATPAPAGNGGGRGTPARSG